MRVAPVPVRAGTGARTKRVEGAGREGAERAGAGAGAVAEARKDRVERYVPLRTSAKEEAPAERMGEQSDTKDLQGTVRVRRCLKPEKEEGREEGERLYPSLLRRDIANNVRQNKLVKSGKKEKREQEKVVAVAGAGAVNAETRYEVETNAEREITILTSNDHMVLRREEGKDEGGGGGCSVL